MRDLEFITGHVTFKLRYNQIQELKTTLIIILISFLGWTALTPSGPGNGTLRVLPLLKETIAYVMMRPLLDDVPDNMMPGYKPQQKGCQFHLVPQIHKKLMDAMISMPKVNPGDTVWWHCDTIHG